MSQAHTNKLETGVPPRQAEKQRTASLSALQSIFPSELDAEQDPESAVGWLAGMLQKGLTQVFAVDLTVCFDAKHHARLLERCGSATNDPDLAAILAAALQAESPDEPAAASGAAPADPGPAGSRGLLERGLKASLQPEAIVQLLTPVAFEGIDRVVHQAQGVGRDRTGVHLTAARSPTIL